MLEAFSCSVQLHKSQQTHCWYSESGVPFVQLFLARWRDKYGRRQKYGVWMSVLCVCQMKLSVLTYMVSMCQSMDASELSNTSDTRLALTRVITWTTDPDSVEVRKVQTPTLTVLYQRHGVWFIQHPYQTFCSNAVVRVIREWVCTWEKLAGNDFDMT